ncbi:DUF885 domain-containing protein [Terricaulis sp.]|uniref:DUF885 domain-containing protein n=1 Tax=Terricaulis sp. TaxID=2768686 RepID=UPI003783A977
MKRIILAAAVALSAVSPASAQTGGGASAALTQLFNDERAFVYREDPLSATSEGIHDYDDHLASVTPAAQARQTAENRAFLTRLHAIDRTALSQQEQVSYDLFDFMITQRVTFARYNDWRLPINSDSGFYSEILQIHDTVSPRTVRDYENYIARLRDVPRYFREQMANMRQGVRDGFTLPSQVIEGVSSVIDGLHWDNVEATPFWTPFANFPETVPQADRARLAAAGRAAISEAVQPAFAEFRAYFANEYRPHARRTIAAQALPNGRAYYADLVRYFTTLPDATPQQIHRTGLAEVARIRAEMETVMQEAGFQGSFSEFLTFLRTDPQFYPKTSEELLGRAALITREIDGHLPEFFGRLPRTPYTVEPVPAAFAPNYTAGRYNPGPFGAAGTYWVNTYALNTRALYQLPALTAHEAAPGHHIQGALARELTGLPRFRLNFYPHAFGEGWGLYSERLAGEMGIYQTPYERFGQLSYEMWRACRLVVDTGMHSMGWTRQQSLDYLAANTALSTHEIRTEVDRYISWPGQALAYKTGELKIFELRHRAEAALGDRFDIRAFHDAVLANGGVTLPVLERQIDAYIAAAQAQR